MLFDIIRRNSVGLEPEDDIIQDIIVGNKYPNYKAQNVFGKDNHKYLKGSISSKSTLFIS